MMYEEQRQADYFRVLLDDFFHNAPIRADGTIDATGYVREIIEELSRFTYEGGKRGVMEARKRLGHHPLVDRITPENLPDPNG